MSNESSTPRVPSHEALTAQLQAYGQWLERRSDVALASARPATDQVAGGPTEPEVDHLPGPGDQPDPPDPPGRQRLLAGAAAAVALIALAAVGVGMLADDGGGGDRIVTGPASDATAEDSSDTPTSDVDEGRELPAAGTESDGSPSGGSDDAIEGSGDVAEGSSAGDAAEGESGVDAATPAEGEGDATTVDPTGDGADGAAEAEGGIPDIVITPSTEVLPSESPTTAGPWQPGSGESMFVSPANGASIDPNVGNVLQAQPVAGATSYRFEGWQNGQQMFDVSVPEPRLLLPSQLITGGGPVGPMEAGSMRLVVSALDASGQMMASGEITVTVQSYARPTPGVTTNPFPTNP